MLFNTKKEIKLFKLRIKEDGRDFCLSLFELATIRLLMHKYAYYILNGNFIDDVAYDGEEKIWYIMGRALNLLEEDEISPCIGFDTAHPLSSNAILEANKLKLK